jgi:tRNA(Ile2) C34 agmatinyltransferase TiaS
MLDEREFGIIGEAYQTAARGVKLARKLANRPLCKSDETALFGEVAARYFEMTGVADVNPREILKHRLSRAGPACSRCGKELRSPAARKCLECGYEGGRSGESGIAREI